MPIVDVMDAAEDLSGLSPLWEMRIEGYRFLLYSGNRMEVYKSDSSAPAYVVTKDGCSCKAAQYGNTQCKHRAVATFVGDGVRPSSVNKQSRPDATSDDYKTITHIQDLL